MTTPAYYGTIHASATDRTLLESFGLTLSDFDSTTGTFLVRASTDALARLADFAGDFPHNLYARRVDINDMQLRVGMTPADLRAEAAFVAFRLAVDSPEQRRRWRSAASAVQAMAASLGRATPAARDGMRLSGEQVTALMRLNHKTIDALAHAMGITKTRVREVREQGVQGEGYVLDWVEALHAADTADEQQNAKLVEFVTLLQDGVVRQSKELAQTDDMGRLSDSARVDAMLQRHVAFSNAICTAKAADFAACGADITERLALMRGPDVVLLTDPMVADWAALEAGEFNALDDPLRREEAAQILTAAMRGNPDLGAALSHEYRHVADKIRSYTDLAQHREALREAHKRGDDVVARPAGRPVEVYTVLTHQGGNRRHVATFSDATDAVAAFQRAPAHQRPYLLATGRLALYRDPQTDAVKLAATATAAMQQAYDQQATMPAGSLARALQEGVRRTDVVLYSPEQGVYLGEAMGLAFWSALETADQLTAPTFTSVDDAQQYLSKWEPPPPKDLQFIWVEAEPTVGFATMEACVRAGLPKWDVSIHAYDDVSPSIH